MSPAFFSPWKLRLLLSSSSLGANTLASGRLRNPLFTSGFHHTTFSAFPFLVKTSIDAYGRGIGNLVLSLSQTSTLPHFYSSSGGNAGLACVSAASLLGHPSTIVTPLSTKPHMVDKIRVAGASEVIQHGASWFDADTYLRTELLPNRRKNGEDALYVPPFDDTRIWEGASSLVQEVEEDLGGPADVMVCSVGGGGLLCGIMRGLERRSGSRTKVVAVETVGADSLNQSILAGKLVTLPGITSIATTLGATRVAPQALTYALQDPARVRSLVVSDAQACGACVRFADEERILVEPACGAALAVVYDKLIHGGGWALGRESKVVVVVCGGVGISTEMIEEWRSEASTRYMGS